MNWIKILLINIFVLFSLIGLLLLTPPIVHFVYKSMQKISTHDTFIDKRSELPNYKDVDWAQLHFTEFSHLSTSYHDTINFRRDDFSGKTITIKDGIRKTFNSNPDSLNQVWFFGGSTTWGTGVNDVNTYPSIFAKKTGSDVTNFGESGYTSRQSLSYLQNLYIKEELKTKRNRLIVFYHGVNDTDGCRTELKEDESSYERVLRKILRSYNSNRYGISETFQQLITFLETVLKRIHSQSENQDNGLYYDCDLDAEKADYIASTIVNTWIQVDKMAKSNNDKFIAILQPVAFLGNPYTDHLDLSNHYQVRLRKQFEILYPLIRAKALQADITFLDLTNIYDECKFCYIDYCHVSVRGHIVLVDKILKSIKPNGELSSYNNHQPK